MHASNRHVVYVVMHNHFDQATKLWRVCMHELMAMHEQMAML